MSALAAAPTAAAPALDPRGAKIAALDAQILGLRDARRLLCEAQRIGHWHYSAGRESSRHTVHAIASAREGIGRELRKVKRERQEFAERDAWLP